MLNFGLRGAKSASERMGALCRFIEYWLGPRKVTYGTPAKQLAKYQLPKPLRLLYGFAGRWPIAGYNVPAFSQQNALLAPRNLRERDGKLLFVRENQGCWSCETLPRGEDPPVWFVGEHLDDQYDKDSKVCDSLSSFLVTFVLHELLWGSRATSADRKLCDLFKANKRKAMSLWSKGPFVYSAYDFYFWEHGLVAGLPFGYVFGANEAEHVEFLQRYQHEMSR